MTNAPIYDAAKQRITSLVEGRDPQTPVAATPGWSVKDVVAHLAGGLREGVRVARVQDDVGAGLRGGKRDDPAEAATPAGDEQALAVQPEAIEHVHGCFHGPFLPPDHITG